MGGTAYQIEIPESWNGRLVLWAHGLRGFGAELTVSAPRVRNHLIEQGYAWAASSYSANGYVPFQGAHETAALHDFFVKEFGQPEYTYLAGESMGGMVTLLSLELFPDRYDGAVASCSSVGLDILDYFSHYVVLGAYAAGVSQDEYDSAASVVGLISQRILTTLESDSQARELFERLIATLTGGPRPFRHEGFEEFYEINFPFADLLVMERGAFDNTNFVYEGDPVSGTRREEVNADVVRIKGYFDVRNADPNFSNLTGAVPIPLIMIHTTGDGLVPFYGMRIYRQLAIKSGNSDLLVQRAIRASRHCGFSQQEWVAALDDLVSWVEEGVRPAGEDVLEPLQSLGLEFTDPLREGDPGGL